MPRQPQEADLEADQNPTQSQNHLLPSKAKQRALKNPLKNPKEKRPLIQARNPPKNQLRSLLEKPHRKRIKPKMPSPHLIIDFPLTLLFQNLKENREIRHFGPFFKTNKQYIY